MINRQYITVVFACFRPGQHNITDPNLNEESKYVAHMTTLISKSKSLNEMGVDICLKNKTYYFNLTQVFRSVCIHFAVMICHRF